MPLVETTLRILNFDLLLGVHVCSVMFSHGVGQLQLLSLWSQE